MQEQPQCPVLQVNPPPPPPTPPHPTPHTHTLHHIQAHVFILFKQNSWFKRDSKYLWGDFLGGDWWLLTIGALSVMQSDSLGDCVIVNHVDVTEGIACGGFVGLEMVISLTSSSDHCRRESQSTKRDTAAVHTGSRLALQHGRRYAGSLLLG